MNGHIRLSVNSGKVCVKGSFTFNLPLADLTDRSAWLSWSQRGRSNRLTSRPSREQLHCPAQSFPLQTARFTWWCILNRRAQPERRTPKPGHSQWHSTSMWQAHQPNTYPFMGEIARPGRVLKAITNYRTGKSIMFAGSRFKAGEWISAPNFDPLNLQFRGGGLAGGNLMRYVMAGSDYGDFYLSPGANLTLGLHDRHTQAGQLSLGRRYSGGLTGAVLRYELVWYTHEGVEKALFRAFNSLEYIKSQNTIGGLAVDIPRGLYQYDQFSVPVTSSGGAGRKEAAYGAAKWRPISCRTGNPNPGRMRKARSISN